MNNSTISIYGNKIFLDILKEVKIFNKFKFKYYEDIDLLLRDERIFGHLLIVFTNSKVIKQVFNKILIKDFPIILINNLPTSKKVLSNQFCEQMNMPFSIKELEKKIIYLTAKNEFKKNSLINLNGYIIDKNERKIKKDNIELQLSEKEINFLILFTQSNDPITKNLVLKNVWKYSSMTETHTVETHIHRLRKKILEKFNDNNFIKNNNKGYYI
jgi:hypothetical protein